MESYSDQALLDLLNTLEADRVERKESFKGISPQKVRQAVCAFANDLPNYNQAGVLFIGAKDNGDTAGLEVTDQLLLNLADIKTDGNILPLPTTTVEKRHLKNADMVVITVLPSDMPPVKYDGRIWIRVGSRRAIASEQEERILSEKRRYKNLPFDIYPILNAKIADLSRLIFESEYLPAAFASDVLETNGRTYAAQLASCKMLVSPSGDTPTLLGLLALGKNPQDFLPGAYIQFLRIDGSELTDEVLDEEKIGGALVEILRRIEEKLAAYNQRSMDISSQATHITSILYPRIALQQIVYNAVLHRTYENTHAPIRVYWFNDRLEIGSPGGPYGNVTPDNFGEAGITDYRNPNIADVLKTFGFIQAFGRGIALAKKALLENGNPKLTFEVNQSTVLCTLWKTP